jgi:hypothetical protein
MATLKFSGYEWEIRSWSGAPGPNQFYVGNALVDDKGALHLKAQPFGGVWKCAEVRTMQLFFGSGTLEYHVQTDLSNLDINVVLGLFAYLRDNPVSVSHIKEMDVEYARWGDPNYKPKGKYTVFPNVDGHSLTDNPFMTSPAGPTVHKIIRSSQGVIFQSFDNSGKQFAGWTFAPSNPLDLVPQDPLLAYLQLWLIKGQAPTNAKPVELIISGFKFTPQGG